MILIERIEDGVAVLEVTDSDGVSTHRSMPLQTLGVAACAGDVLLQTENGWQIDTEATDMRRRLAVQRLHRLIHHEH